MFSIKGRPCGKNCVRPYQAFHHPEVKGVLKKSIKVHDPIRGGISFFKTSPNKSYMDFIFDAFDCILRESHIRMHKKENIRLCFKSAQIHLQRAVRISRFETADRREIP